MFGNTQYPEGSRQEEIVEVWRVIATGYYTLFLVLTLLALSGTGVFAAELTGSQVLTIERSDAGDVYAALSVVLEYALTSQWSAVLIHDQAAAFPGERYAEWDTSIAWSLGPGWSLSVGRRWRVGPPPDYGGPWTYVQVWRGM